MTLHLLQHEQPQALPAWEWKVEKIKCQMVELRTAELLGPALDWAVAKACNFQLRHRVRGPEGGGFHAVGKAYGYIWTDSCPNEGMSHYGWSPSRKWVDGGPLFMQQGKRIDLELRISENSASYMQSGMRIGYTASDVLIAGCRAIVAASLGDTVQVPSELAGGV